MAIEGLRGAPQICEVNISDHVGATVQALDMLGLVADRDQVTESVSAEFTTLLQSGVAGEAYIQLPREVITLADLVRVFDSSTYAADRKYPETSVNHKLWTPGTSKGGYSAEDLDNLTFAPANDYPPHARLAVHNSPSQHEPLLYFLDQPFDDVFAEKGHQTQLDAIAEAAGAYNAEHEDFEMTPLTAKAVAMLAMVRRIKGLAMPMAWGSMRDGTLSRRTLDGGSVVGRVGFGDSRLILRGSLGDADLDEGVGLSVGPKMPKLA